jgi:hypothetical protein
MLVPVRTPPADKNSLPKLSGDRAGPLALLKRASRRGGMRRWAGPTRRADGPSGDRAEPLVPPAVHSATGRASSGAPALCTD